MNTSKLYIALFASLIAAAAVTAPCYAAKKKAKAAAPTPSFEESFEAGRDAFLNYDFDEAERLFSLADKKANDEQSEILEAYQNRVSTAQEFLNRVEKIVVLDSITVPKIDFFKAYKLPASAGFLAGQEGLPYQVDDVEYVFTNEGDDFKMWAQPDSTGFYRIAESIRLTDGSWHEPTLAPEELGSNGNAEFPFMMADGVTLYYASDGDDSIGGYDIFVATRDAASGEYLQPQNIGMPYNSPFDDYLLAIDELNGVGWWATDRNQLGDDLTVYLFKVNDLRVNYKSDEEDDITALARISDFKATQDPEEDYSELIAEVKSIRPEVAKKADFYFPVSSQLTYTTLSDCRNNAERSALRKYLAEEKSYQEQQRKLSELRANYAKSKTNTLKSQILRSEKEIEQARANLKKARNEVYRAMGKK